jgi:hypothetical protein
MPSYIRSLAWKEWKERRGSLTLATAWVLGGTIYAIVDEVALQIRAPVGTFEGTCVLYGLFAPIFLAMRTALGEQTHGTRAFTSALPATRRQIAGARLSGAIVTLVAPIVLGATILSIALWAGVIEQAQPRSEDAWNGVELVRRPSLSGIEAAGFTWRVAAISAAADTELLLILAVIGAKRRSEAEVGLIGAVASFAWLATINIRRPFRDTEYRQLVNWLGAVLPESLVVPNSYSTAQGSYQDLEFAGRLWGPLALNVLVLVALGTWLVRRYGALPLSASRRFFWIDWRPPSFFSRLPLRWPGRAAALAWLDLRQSLPVAFAGLALAMLITVLDVGLFPASRDPSESVSTIARHRLPGTMMVIAFLWSAVVAAAVFGSELQAGLANFWRSRPIGVFSWFWIKFAVGLLAVVGVLDGIPTALAWNSPYRRYPDHTNTAYLLCMPLFHAMIYSLAVFAMCRLRRPVLAVMCASVPYLMIAILQTDFRATSTFDPASVYDGLSSSEVTYANLSAHHYPLVYGTVALILVVAAWSAFRTVRRWSTAAD